MMRLDQVISPAEFAENENKKTVEMVFVMMIMCDDDA